MTQTNYVTMIVGFLGALKLAFQAFGYSFITDDQINAVANVVAIFITFGVGIYMNHKKEVNTDVSNNQ
jgi:hypothetical protein